MGSLSFKCEDQLKRELDLSSAEVLKKSGFIGCIKSSEKDVSVSYKKRLSKNLKKKHEIK